MRKASLLAIVAVFAVSSFANAQLQINLQPTGNADADQGFRMAADFWSSVFDDDLTINVNSGFQSLGGPLAQAGSARRRFNYGAVRDALANDATNAVDAGFASSLNQGDSFDVYINRTSDNPNGAQSATPYIDAQESIVMTTANAKALGLRDPNDVSTDVTITFSSDFAFDFDPTDGINAGEFDFVGIAIHEIGHTLGFVSGVDFFQSNNNGTADDSEFASVIDLTRNSPDSVAAGADIDLTADTRPKYFSLDGGLTAAAPGLDHFSLGTVFGDGRQASHWRDGLGLGILDPTAAPRGQLNIVTELDITAFDVIGWNRIVAVPEPSSMMILGVVGGVMALRRKRMFA